MTDNALYKDYENYMCWIPETAFRKNDSVTDESNDAADTGYRLCGRFKSQPIIYRKVKRMYQRVANALDYGYIGNDGYMDGKLTLSMEMIDLSLLYYAVKGCTTTDDTPSASKYTHVYATTTTRATTVPSFALYHRITNDDGDNTMLHLYTGCVIHGFVITGQLDGVISITLDIRFANVVTATQLTTEPSFGVLKPYSMVYTSVTYAKGGTAYEGGCHEFETTYIDGTVLHRAANDEFPAEALNGPRDIRVMIEYAPKQVECLNDTLITPLAAATASDVDITIKMYRNTTNDYTQFAFEKLWCINTPRS